ncbi:MAG: protein kinase, partial [Vicinamibacteria bacterium]
MKRFKQELLLARRITHKNVVRIYDPGEAHGITFFTMELIDGESLKDVIRKEGGIPVEKVLEMLPPMLSALGEAHEQEVVHRDLKPQNIMISRDGMPHIMDFGIARASDASTMTTTGSVLGTPDYMSPEQVSGESTDAQSDLFSFGVILYEMLTGTVPYDADTPVAKVMMRLTQKPRPPRELNPAIPRYLEKIVLKCLDTDRELRYKNAAEVLEDLEREQVDSSLTLKAWRGLVRRKAGLAAAAALTLAVSGTAYLSRGTQATEPAVGPAGEEEPVTTLAVLPFTNATGSGELQWMRNGLSEMVITDLSQSRYVRPVPGERVFKVLRELGVEGQTRFDEATLSAVADLAPAQAVLYGQFVASGEQFRMDLTLRQGNSGVPIPIKVEGETSQVFAMVDQITQRVKEQLDLSPDQLKGDIDRPVAEVSTASLDALRIYQSGLEKIRDGANQEAILLFTEATEADHNFAMAHAKLAEAYINGGRYDDAQTAIARSEELSESASLPLSERYQIHAIRARATNDFETAVESYRELAKMYPDDPDVVLSLAAALEELGDFSGAIEAYQSVIQLAPEYGAALLGLGRSQGANSHATEAIGSLKRALETGQFDDDVEALARIHAIMGTAYRDIGELDTATEHFMTSLDLRRNTGDKSGEAATLLELAAVYEFRGDVDEAFQEIEQMVGVAVVQLQLAETYADQGRYADAYRALQQSLSIYKERDMRPGLAEAKGHLGRLLPSLGRLDEAEKELAEAAELVRVAQADGLEPFVLLAKSRVQRLRGKPGEEFAKSALEAGSRVGEKKLQVLSMVELGGVQLAEGRLAAAHR